MNYNNGQRCCLVIIRTKTVAPKTIFEFNDMFSCLITQYNQKMSYNYIILSQLLSFLTDIFDFTLIARLMVFIMPLIQMIFYIRGTYTYIYLFRFHCIVQIRVHSTNNYNTIFFLTCLSQ